jgi:hypothetical protein
MLTVTEKACTFAEQLLAQPDTPDGSCVRIEVDNDGKGQLVLGSEQPGDVKHEHDGKTVLLVSQAAGQLFDGKTLDAEDTDKGTQLLLR